MLLRTKKTKLKISIIETIAVRVMDRNKWLETKNKKGIFHSTKFDRRLGDRSRKNRFFFVQYIFYDYTTNRGKKLRITSNL